MSCADMLQQAMAEYQHLTLGEPEVVKMKSAASGFEVEYRQRSVPQLLATIQQLYKVCPCEAARGILGYGRRKPATPVYVDGYYSVGGRNGCC